MAPPIFRRRERLRFGTRIISRSATSGRHEPWRICAAIRASTSTSSTHSHARVRFKGIASILEIGPAYDRAIDFYRARGSKVSAFKQVVLIEIREAQFIDSPAYDYGMTESEIRDRWERHYELLRSGVRSPSDPEIPESSPSSNA